MSYVKSSRMPHAYAPVGEDPSLRDSVSDMVKRAEDGIQSVPPLNWVLGLVGAGAVGAGIYAAFFRGDPKSRSASRRRGAQKRRPRAASTGARQRRAKAAAAE